MDLQIQKLSKKHLPMVNAFSCIETQQYLNQYNSKERRRILKHSKEMDSFLKTEAYTEQEDGLKKGLFVYGYSFVGNRKDCYKHRLSFYKSIGFVENVIQPIVLPYDTPISMHLDIKEYLSQLALAK